MSKSQKTVAIITTVGILGIVMLGFQNCSKTRFTDTSGATILKTADIAEGDVSQPGDDGVVPGDGQDVPPAAPGDGDVADTPSPTSSPTDGVVKGNPNPKFNDVPQDGDVPPAGGKKDQPSDQPTDGQEVADLVECQMLHPNKKIILAPEFEVSPSNKSATRVCMSRHACLELINAYAVKHDCSLATGAGQEAASDLQCTEIFPGSKGTCHNATILSDDQVSGILDVLAAK